MSIDIKRTYGGLPPIPPERQAKLRILVECHARDDAREDLDYENWGRLISPWDVLSLLDECHGRRFDPNLVAEVKRLRGLLGEALNVVDDCVRRHEPDGRSVTAARIRKEAGL